MENLPSILQIALKGAQAVMEQDGHIIPAALIMGRRDPETRQTKRMFLPVQGLMSTCDATEKSAWDAGIRKLMEDSDADEIATIHEAWKVSNIPEATLTRWRAEGLANHPERLEIVIVHYESESGQIMDFEAKLIREEGKPPRLGPFEKTGSNNMHGRLIGFFKSKVKA